MQVEDSIDIPALVGKLYGSVPSCVTGMSGYDDFNFKLDFSEGGTVPTGTEGISATSKYVLKIVNPLDSSRNMLTNSIAAVLSRLPNMNLRVPRPLECLDGNLCGRIDIGGAFRNVVLLTYVEGLDHKMLRYEKDLFGKLCEEIGYCAALLLDGLSKVESSDLEETLTRNGDEYMLQNLHLQRKKLEVVGDESIRNVCSDTMNVIEVLADTNNELRKGIIHHDLCVENLIFCKNFCGEYEVVGAIDFSDMTYSFYVFEVAIPIASAMYQAFVLELLPHKEAAKAVLKGFERFFPLTKSEKEFLYYAVMARFVSLRVIGGYDVSRSSKTADHEEHNTESLEYFIESMAKDGKEKWDEVFCSS